MTEGYKVADIKLAEKGREGLYLAGRKMPVTAGIIREDFSKNKPLKGIRIGACLHVTKETGNLARTLMAGGAEVYMCGSNPLSTQDDAAAAMVEDGVHVYAWHGNTNEEYYWCVRQVLDAKPHILIDDGGDLIVTAHKEYPDLIKNGIIACQEETTTGVKRFESMEASGNLKIPLFPVNDARCKNEFDNELGTGQGIVSAIYGMHILFAGKTVVIAGYGHCSSGMALRARGLGAKVIVTEIDPIAALKATYAGYQVMKMDDAISQADVVFTATGCSDVVARKHFDKLKDGCILGNLGHFDIEIATKDLYAYATTRKNIRKDVEELTLPNENKIYLLGQGRLANLVLSEGHPAEVMDQSFALQSLISKYIIENREIFNPGIIKVPEDIDNQVGFLKLQTMGIEIDEWTEEQRRYVMGFEEGT
ncbi:MAG: adenosylhomocysteinase [Candidatus Lokiarchaeota archaeon]|nr:adenosylhomocysteinase [Candidatus Lokiarchaeota archaeon]